MKLLSSPRGINSVHCCSMFMYFFFFFGLFIFPPFYGVSFAAVEKQLSCADWDAFMIVINMECVYKLPRWLFTWDSKRQLHWFSFTHIPLAVEKQLSSYAIWCWHFTAIKPTLKSNLRFWTVTKGYTNLSQGMWKFKILFITK